MRDAQIVVFLKAVSRLFGWLYFLCWSLSFYPQAYKNYRRRTTQGLTPDYPLLNVVGFSSYTISTAVFLFSPVVRAQYAGRHPGSPEPTVRGNDLAFGLHAWVLVVITYSQFFPWLWGWPKSDAKLRANRVSLALIVASLIAVLVTIGLVLTSQKGDEHVRAQAWAWLDVVYVLSYIKLALTFFKYIPQVAENYRRKSTVGWAIWQVLLDFAGGILSLAQLVIDSGLQNDWSGLVGNPAKFGLANISIIFDVIFMVQHFVLYRPKGGDGQVEEDESQADDGERRPLLQE